MGVEVVMAFTIKATAISPKPFDIRKLEAEIGKALTEEGKRDAKTLSKTTEGWSSAPPMGYTIELKAKEASVWIGPWGTPELIDKWRRIDEGMEEHPIDSDTTMIFPWQGVGRSYTAKTTPKQFSSSSTSTKHGPIRRTKHIKAHYITPREWSKTLAEQRIEPFADSIQEAINRGLEE